MAKPLSILPPEFLAPARQTGSLPVALADLSRVVHEPARLAVLTAGAVDPARGSVFDLD